MASTAWTQQDLDQMSSLGISPDQVDQQIRLFKAPPPFIHLARPAVLQDGISRLTDRQISEALEVYASAQKRFLKFVPASGAATRMFQSLFKFIEEGAGQREKIKKDAESGDKDSAQILEFMENLSKLAFYAALKESLAKKGHSLEDLLSLGEYGTVLKYLLGPDGLDYAKLPKGLIQFHGYAKGAMTAFEEQLSEGVQTATGVHFTISEEHRTHFKEHYLVTEQGKELAVDFSVQDQATQTLAVTSTNEPFRDEKGRLVFRPAGHGALLRNLDRLQGDLIFIKNIDNVAAEPLSKETVRWKKILGGYLISLQERIFNYLERLEGDEDEALLKAAADFCKNELYLDLGKAFEALGPTAQKKHLVALMNRPLRVCGVVVNTGEPGGGPFWVRDSTGELSLQIVESAQVNRQDPAQKDIFDQATHFNPVDLLCAVRDRQGKPFALANYVDPKAVFITEKSVNGQKVKALELPGLWNGSMAYWTTVFVEVPASTFNPVKTVFDLLRPAHQA